MLLQDFSYDATMVKRALMVVLAMLTIPILGAHTVAKAGGPFCWPEEF